MSGLRTLASQTAIYGISSILGRVLNYLLFPLYTRVFAEGEYGTVTEMYAYVAILLVLLTYGMETAFFRFSSIETEKSRKEAVFSTAFISIFTTTTVFLLLSTLTADSIAFQLGYGEHPEYVTWFAWIIAFDVIATIPFARLRHLNKPFSFVFINLAHILLNIGLNLFLILYCPWALKNPDAPLHIFVEQWYDPSIGIGYIFIANLASSALKFALLLPFISGIRWHFSLSILRKLLPYSMPLLLLGLAGIVNETFDRAFFSILSGLPEDQALVQLGIYGACYKVAMLLSIGIQAYRFAAEPFIFSSGRTSEESNRMQALIMKYYFIAATFITLILLCFIDLVILMVGPKFREGIGVIPILLFAYVCFGAVFNLSFWYKLSNKTIYGALTACIGAVITIVANIVLIPEMGYHGAAWATLMAYVAMMLFSYLLGQKLHPVPYNLKEIGLYTGLGAILWLAFIALDADGALRYVIASAAVITYSTVVYLREKN